MQIGAPTKLLWLSGTSKMRRYLSYRPGEEFRIFWLLDYAATGSPLIYSFPQLLILAFPWILKKKAGFQFLLHHSLNNHLKRMAR